MLRLETTARVIDTVEKQKRLYDLGRRPNILLLDGGRGCS